jgi:hypothetical protein
MGSSRSWETGEEQVVGSFPYESGRGRCLILKMGEPPQYIVYLEDDGRKPVRMEAHRSLKNAEAVARWMASGL